MDDAQLREKVEIAIRRLRRFGVVFFVVSLLFTGFAVYIAFDRSVPFRINGVESTDTVERVRAAAYSVVMPIFSALFAFGPRSWLERVLRRQFVKIETLKKRRGLIR